MPVPHDVSRGSKGSSSIVARAIASLGSNGLMVGQSLQPDVSPSGTKNARRNEVAARPPHVQSSSPTPRTPSGMSSSTSRPTHPPTPAPAAGPSSPSPRQKRYTHQQELLARSLRHLAHERPTSDLQTRGLKRVLAVLDKKAHDARARAAELRAQLVPGADLSPAAHRAMQEEAWREARRGALLEEQSAAVQRALAAPAPGDAETPSARISRSTNRPASLARFLDRSPTCVPLPRHRQSTVQAASLCWPRRIDRVRPLRLRARTPPSFVPDAGARAAHAKPATPAPPVSCLLDAASYKALDPAGGAPGAGVARIYSTATVRSRAAILAALDAEAEHAPLPAYAQDLLAELAAQPAPVTLLPLFAPPVAGPAPPSRLFSLEAHDTPRPPRAKDKPGALPFPAKPEHRPAGSVGSVPESFVMMGRPSVDGSVLLDRAGRPHSVGRSRFSLIGGQEGSVVGRLRRKISVLRRE